MIAEGEAGAGAAVRTARSGVELPWVRRPRARRRDVDGVRPWRGNDRTYQIVTQQ
jgi:hypothetical protein